MESKYDLLLLIKRFLFFVDSPGALLLNACDPSTTLFVKVHRRILFVPFSDG